MKMTPNKVLTGITISVMGALGAQPCPSLGSATTHLHPIKPATAGTSEVPQTIIFNDINDSHTLRNSKAQEFIYRSTKNTSGACEAVWCKGELRKL